MVAKGFTTCLWFDGTAEEAANHYVSIFKDSQLGEVMHAPSDTPSGAEGTVLTVEFTANGQKFVGLNGGPHFTFSEAISFQIFCADQEEVDYYWSRLTEGGEESECGWLKDKFGVSWQVIPEEMFGLLSDADPDKARRTNEAMLATHGKLDIAALKKAHAGG